MAGCCKCFRRCFGGRQDDGGRQDNEETGVALVEATSSLRRHRNEFFDRQAQAVPVIKRDAGKAKALAVRSAAAVKHRADLETAAYAITDDGDRLIVLQTVIELVENAYKEEKYRSVNASSKVLEERVLGRGGVPLLVAAGFQDCGQAWEFPADACQGDTHEHLQALRTLLDAVQKKATQQVEDKVAFARQLQNNGDVAGAAAVLERILGEKDSTAVAGSASKVYIQRLLGMLYAYMQRFEEAMMIFEEALAVSGGAYDELGLAIGHGSALLGAGRPKEAIGHFETAQVLAAKDGATEIAAAVTLALLGGAQLASGDIDSAVKSLEAALPMACSGSFCTNKDAIQQLREMEMYVRTQLAQVYERLGRTLEAANQREAAQNSELIAIRVSMGLRCTEEEITAAFVAKASKLACYVPGATGEHSAP